MTRTTPITASIVLVTMLLVGAACSRSTSTTTNTTTNTAAVRIPRGLSFSPSAITTAGLNDFFTRAVQVGSFVSWGGPAADLAKANGGPILVLTQAKKYSLTPIFIVSPTTDDLRNDEAWTAWRDIVVNFASAKQVEYLGVGNEINKSLTAADLKTFSQRFAALVVDINAVSPTTKVFVTLQYEWLVGMRGGLFGGKNDAVQNQWTDPSLQPFFSGDLIAFTTYPGLVYKTPTDIPAEYYTDILKHTNNLMAFTEFGWFRTGPTGWDSSVDEQAAAISRFRALTAAVTPIFSLWSFLYDPPVDPPFATLGLLKVGESDSAAWQAWMVK